MDLTRKDRLILWNQYHILEALYPKEAEHYEICKKIVAEGYKTHYDSLYEHIDEHEFSEESAHEVMDILSMFEALQDSSAKVGEVEEVKGIESWLARFPGFDGNYEGEQLGYLYFLVKKGSYIHVVDPKRLNSHAPLLGRYREMLVTWNEMGRPSMLGAEQVKKLFSWWEKPE